MSSSLTPGGRPAYRSCWDRADTARGRTHPGRYRLRERIARATRRLGRRVRTRRPVRGRRGDVVVQGPHGRPVGPPRADDLATGPGGACTTRDATRRSRPRGDARRSSNAAHALSAAEPLRSDGRSTGPHIVTRHARRDLPELYRRFRRSVGQYRRLRWAVGAARDLTPTARTRRAQLERRIASLASEPPRVLGVAWAGAFHVVRGDAGDRRMDPYLSLVLDRLAGGVDGEGSRVSRDGRQSKGSTTSAEVIGLRSPETRASCHDRSSTTGAETHATTMGDGPTTRPAGRPPCPLRKAWTAWISVPRWNVWSPAMTAAGWRRRSRPRRRLSGSSGISGRMPLPGSGGRGPIGSSPPNDSGSGCRDPARDDLSRQPGALPSRPPRPRRDQRSRACPVRRSERCSLGRVATGRRRGRDRLPSRRPRDHAPACDQRTSARPFVENSGWPT